MKKTPKVQTAEQEAFSPEIASAASEMQDNSAPCASILTEYEQDFPPYDDTPEPQPNKAPTILDKKFAAENYLQKMQKLDRMESSKFELISAGNSMGSNDKFTLECAGKPFNTTNSHFIKLVYDTLLQFIEEQINELKKDLESFKI
ncbi:hypothetical protein [Rhodoflexus caldus]|uniref:hypothetical protein n=1 Tax=Rhodoflexus caldus TaxID=2891236 RepID=UPI00202A07AE|nr:hypothetical protein [Rhodoflexus caldus]